MNTSSVNELDFNKTQENTIVSSPYINQVRKMFHKSLKACKSSPNLTLGSKDNEKRNNSPRLFRNLSNDQLNSPVMNPHKALIDLYRKFSDNKSSYSANPFALKKKKLKNLEDIYNYSNKENTFTVKIQKSNHLLGLSIYGGKDTSKKDPFYQFIRIWNLHPSRPALECGKLALGDIILAVNGTSLLGLTYSEALEVLRSVPSEVELKIFRPQKCFIQSSFSAFKVFEITLMKRDGCLGFSIIHENNTKNPIGGIYVKALTREHAISDGRIQPGDRILEVNGTDVSTFSHTEALTCLRNASKLVTLKLQRYKESPKCCRKSRLPKVYTFNVILEKKPNESLGFCIWDPINDGLNTPTDVLPCATEVKDVSPGSLAESNGIKIGDRILEVNGKSLLDKAADEVGYILRNANGVIRMVFCRLEQGQEEAFD